VIAGRKVETSLADARGGQADDRVIAAIPIAHGDGCEPERNAEIEDLKTVAGIECVGNDEYSSLHRGIAAGSRSAGRRDCKLLKDPGLDGTGGCRCGE